MNRNGWVFFFAIISNIGFWVVLFGVERKISVDVMLAYSVIAMSLVGVFLLKWWRDRRRSRTERGQVLRFPHEFTLSSESAPRHQLVVIEVVPATCRFAPWARI